MITSNASIRKKLNFSSVPDAIFTDLRLSLDTRTVLGWALGRPDGWKFRVGHMCFTLGVSDKKWPRIRDEMVAAGYLFIFKKRGPVFSEKANKIIENAIIWEYEFTDEPLLSPIPPSQGDGEKLTNLQKLIPPKRRDGSRMDGEGEDYQEEEATVINNSPAPPARNTPEPPAQGANPPPSAGVSVELFKSHERWSDLIGRVKKSSKRYFCGQLCQLTLINGDSLRVHHVDAIFTYLLSKTHDPSPIPALQGILKGGGWDPRRLADAAQPGETRSQTKNRLSSRSDSKKEEESRIARKVNILVSNIKSTRDKYPKNPEFAEPYINELFEFCPDHPIIAAS